jgi:hypothetical protein
VNLGEILQIIDAGGMVGLALVVFIGLKWGFTILRDVLDGLRTDLREDRRDFIEAVRANGEQIAKIDERTIVIVKQTRPPRPITMPPNGGTRR